MQSSLASAVKAPKLSQRTQMDAPVLRYVSRLKAIKDMRALKLRCRTAECDMMQTLFVMAISTIKIILT